MMELQIILFIAALLISLVVSRVVITLLGRKLLDVPNDRSSHSVATPRGGGIAILTATLCTLTCAFLSGALEAQALYLLIPGIVMGLVGVADDFLSLNIRIRLLIQLTLAGVTTLAIFSNAALPLLLIIVLGIMATLGITWLTNLFNFMDGINGIAALQTICVCASMCLLFALSGSHLETLPVMITLAGASLGFLYWNFPRARLFMGDVGSLFIGITLATLTIWTSATEPFSLYLWLIALCFFIADATYTLFYRLFTGQKFYLPHRTHTYQKLALKLNSHPKTTLLVTGFNLVWLMPLALLTQEEILPPWIALVAAYSPALGLAYWIKAGKPE